MALSNESFCFAGGGRSRRGGISTGMAAWNRGALGTAIWKAHDRNTLEPERPLAHTKRTHTKIGKHACGMNRVPNCSPIALDRFWYKTGSDDTSVVDRWRKLSRVHVGEQILLKRFSWTMARETQPPRQSIGRLESCIVQLLQRQAGSILDETEIVKRCGFTWHKIENET